MSNSLSENWNRVKLESILEKITNGANVKQVDEPLGLPVSRIETIWNETIDTSRVKYVVDYSQELIDKYSLKANDILFSHINSDAHLGKTAIYKGHPETLIHGINLLLIRLKGTVDCSFINYQFKYKRKRGDFIAIAQKSVNQSSINQAKLKNLELVLPPLPIQQAIVARLEALFSELDKGIEQVKTARQQLRTYRQAVLKAAFEGRLTGEQVKEGELPEGWKWEKSGDLFDFVTSGSRGWAQYYSESGSIFIRITNLDFDTLDLDLDPSKIQFVNPPNGAEGLRTKVEEGDFLFSITGYLGMFAIAPKLDSAFVNQHIALCRPKKTFDSKFVGYWIISKTGGHFHLNQKTKGATKAGLSLDDIKSFPVPIAPLDTQSRIVSEIESRLSVADKLEETIAQGLQQAEALRQSILKKAFEGELKIN